MVKEEDRVIEFEKVMQLERLLPLCDAALRLSYIKRP